MAYYHWDALFQLCQTCQKCGLADSRRHVVFGAGVPTAEVLLVGEGPGAQEDASGQPFVGQSGKLLDEMLSLVDLSRESNIYIANMVKCRPPQNRDPLLTEQEACLPYLRNQFLLLKPKIVVCLGRVAAQKLIHPDFKISTQHGQFVEKKGCLFTGHYHPAALLRNPSLRPLAYEDWKGVQQQIRTLCTHTYPEQL